MKNLVLGSISLLAACQNPSTTVTATEQPLEDICQVQAPAAEPWKGVLPPTSSTTTLVLLRYEQDKSAGWRAYAADPKHRKIYWVLALDEKTIGPYLEASLVSDHDQISIRNPPPPRCPPGPCGDDWYAFAVAQRVGFAVVEAEADIEGCFK